MDDGRAPPMWIILFVLICQLSLICSVGGVLCPNGCKCQNEILRANCSGAGIQVVPIQLNPELHVMDLSDNKILQLHYTFTFYENLYTLDVSRNKVKDIGNGNFKTQKLLKFLNLSSNYIEFLGKDAFEGLVQLTELDLSRNQLETIGPSAFKDLRNLIVLRINDNQLDFLEEGTFKGTPNIQALYIDDNSFLEIPSELSDLTHLKILSISRNLIEVIKDDEMPSLLELQTLLLDQNLLKEIHPMAFTSMPKLNYLDLSDNNLTSLPTTQLSKLPKLANLKLSGNTFTHLPPVSFRGLFNLKYVKLTRLESLTAIDVRAFVDNINLEKISLDYNYNVNNIPTRLFHGNTKLRYISIRYNAIKILAATHFPLDQMEELKVGGNPLDCNCSMLWLWKILQDNKLQIRDNVSHYRKSVVDDKASKLPSELKLDINDIICETPPNLHNKKLVSASQREIDCSMSWLAILSVTLTVVFILGIIIGVLIFMPKKKSNVGRDRHLPKIVKGGYNAPPLPPPRKPLPNNDVNHVERFIVPPILLQNRSMPLWDSYSQHCNGNGNIYKQLDDQQDRPHIVYV
ncbi:unnamed protein product [Ceutorhynchus assimilis]|uniref:LRRCT domain-containing protein n=1 Tax=Ceutorhynchus assimilis TaxID=467358 RepID=A0A9P0GLS9_9CUCU|nr:unnamed protein product [Ceutorhynchus assimilis]